MFCFKVGQFLSEMKIYAPQVFNTIAGIWDQCVKDKTENNERITMPKSLFKACPDISIDYALMEKSDYIAVIPADLGWSDIGSWLSYRDLVKPDQDGNRIMGEGLFIKSTHTFIKSSNRIVAAVGVKNLIIIDTDHALLIVDQSRTQDVKLLVNKLKEIRITHKTKPLN